MDDALAAAVHAWIAHAGSVLASVQVDDLAGETVATNLPGTDRERPNWRHRRTQDAAAAVRCAARAGDPRGDARGAAAAERDARLSIEALASGSPISASPW